MILRYFGFVRHIVYALIALTLLVCAVEVGLQVYEVGTGQRLAAGDSIDSQLTVDSSVCFGRLSPLMRAERPHPDTREAVEIRTNTLGYRGPEPQLPKPAGRLRILLLGDDVVFGGEVAEDQTVASWLSHFLKQHSDRDLEVMNAGTPGSCPLLSLLQFRHSLIQLAPDIVVLNFSMDDVDDDHAVRRYLKLSGDGVPLACPAPTPVAEGRVASSLGRFVTVRWLRDQLTATFEGAAAPSRIRDSPYAWLRESNPAWATRIRHAFQPIAHLRELVESVSSRFVLTVSPAPWQVSASACCPKVRAVFGIDSDDCYRSRHPFFALKEFADTRGISFVDPSPKFVETPGAERLFLTNCRNYSSYGHKLHARELARFLLQLPEFDGVETYDQQRRGPVFYEASAGRALERR